MKAVARHYVGWATLAAICSCLPGCFLTRLGDLELGEACSTDEDCGGDAICWRLPSRGYRLCAPPVYAACVDQGGSHEDCRELLGDAGTPDFGMPDGDDMDAGTSVEAPEDAGADPVDELEPDDSGDPDVSGDPDTDLAADHDIDMDRDLAVDPDIDMDSDLAADPDIDTDPDIVLMPPQAEPDTYSLTGGSALIVPDPGVLDNDTTFGGPLTAVRDDSPTSGNLTLGSGGGFTYIHDGSQTVVDSFSYRAFDGILSSEPVAVTLLINVAPAALDQNVIIPEDEAITITLQATDANDDDLTYELVEQPESGNLSGLDETAGTVTYTPDAGFAGVDDFTFKADDGELDSNVATVTLSVNGAPGFTALPSMQSTLADRTLGPLTVTIDDPDDELGDVALTASSDRQDIVPDGNIAVAGGGQNRSLTLITEPGVAGLVIVTLEASDGPNVVTAGLTVHVGVTNDFDDIAVHGSIRRALDIAQNGDTITFDPDHFNVGASEEELTITLESQLEIDRDLTIQGPGQELLILSGSNSVRVIRVATGVRLELNDLTLSDGAALGSGEDGGGILNDAGDVTLYDTAVSANLAEDDGGGIYNAGSGQMTITDSTVSNNSATGGMGSSGGGIYNTGPGQVTVTNSTLAGNSANFAGGGIYNAGPGEVMVINSTISGNSAAGGASGGGGIYNVGLVTVTNSILSGNSADSVGGGIQNEGSAGQATVTNSTLSGNSAAGGGGISNSGLAQLTVTNSTFSENSVGSSGGAIFNSSSGPVTVTHSTLFENRADANADGTGTGGGIRSSSPNVALRGTIVAGNVRGFGAGTPDDITNSASLDSSSGYNLVADADSADILEDGDENGNIVGVDWTTVLDSLLADNGGPTQTHAVIPGSPAIDHIPTADCDDADGNPLTTDQRSAPRPSGALCDIGAFERQPGD